MFIPNLEKHLERLKDVEVAVIGDFCLDAYYRIDPEHSELSLETGQPVRAVSQMRFSLGGASNVANNLIDLGVRNVYAVGVVGDDCFGKELFRLFDGKGIDRSHICIQSGEWDTHVYSKVIDGEHELERIDFGTFNRLNAETENRLLEAIRRLAEKVGHFVVNEQFVHGIHTPGFREGLRRIMKEFPQTVFIADCRDYNTEYPDAVHKLNNREGSILCGLPDTDDPSEEQAREVAGRLREMWQKPLFLTRGERGCLVCDENGIRTVPGFHITAKVDTVGAGDSMLAGIAASLAAGCRPDEAAEFGNMVAGITIQKLFTTGTATPAEITAFAATADYAYNHDLAESVRRARYFEGSEIEIVTGRESPHDFAFAVFDHDGTFSTLRQGWEQVMEPVMIRAILGDQYDKASEALFEKIEQDVRQFIDKTTGIQTLVQMQGLVKMVREYGFVPEEQILDEFGYKTLYNEALMEMVNRRIEKVRRGELGLEDVTVKGSFGLLKALREMGVRLFLASGTDEEDVRREAELLGYASYFDGGIWGAVNDIKHEPKKIVLNNIINSVGRENASRIVTFGDGPVEIRETAKAGGFTVGVASDEIRRYGLNETKRRRLILAGADIVIPDYSQLEQLKQLIF